MFFRAIRAIRVIRVNRVLMGKIGSLTVLVSACSPSLNLARFQTSVSHLFLACFGRHLGFKKRRSCATVHEEQCAQGARMVSVGRREGGRKRGFVEAVAPWFLACCAGALW